MILGTRGVVELPDNARGKAECFIMATRPHPEFRKSRNAHLVIFKWFIVHYAYIAHAPTFDVIISMVIPW